MLLNDVESLSKIRDDDDLFISFCVEFLEHDSERE